MGVVPHEKKMVRETVVRVPPNVKPETLEDIKRVMGDKPYRIEEYTPKYGWNSLIPITKAEVG